MFGRHMGIILGCTRRTWDDTLTNSGYHVAEGNVNLRRQLVGEVTLVQDLNRWDAAADYDHEQFRAGSNMISGCLMLKL